MQETLAYYFRPTACLSRINLIGSIRKSLRLTTKKMERCQASLKKDEQHLCCFIPEV